MYIFRELIYAWKLGFSGETWIFLQVRTCKCNFCQVKTQANKSHLQMDMYYHINFHHNRRNHLWVYWMLRFGGKKNAASIIPSTLVSLEVSATFSANRRVRGSWAVCHWQTCPKKSISRWKSILFWWWVQQDSFPFFSMFAQWSSCYDIVPKI